MGLGAEVEECVGEVLGGEGAFLGCEEEVEGVEDEEDLVGGRGAGL